MAAPPSQPPAWPQRLFAPVDIASLVVFRVLFGLVMVWEVVRFLDHGWVASFYIDWSFYFKYYGFEWVEPLPGEGMYWFFAAMGVVALCFTVGFLYRLMSVLLFLGVTYWFLLDQTRYLNHFYLVCIFAFLMMWMPAHRLLSVDVRLRPSLRSQTAPAWCLRLLRFQVGLVYLYAGVAKLNPDWLAGEPVRSWVAARADMPILGKLFGAPGAGWFFAYGGLLFDLLVVPALLWRRTRPLALFVALFFHATNKVIFDIGIFPVLMMCATLLYLPADWPRRAVLLVPRRGPEPDPPWQPTAGLGFRRRLIVTGLVGFVLVQMLVPLRHHLYPGRVAWTDEGHRFSWRMKLRDKSAARTRFLVRDRLTGETWEHDQRRDLSTAQRRKVGTWFDMAQQYAHHVGEHYAYQGRDVSVHVETWVSLNGRRPALMIDPEVDLSREPRTLLPAPWLLPLQPTSSPPR